MPRHVTTDLLPLNPIDFLVLAVLADGQLHGYGLAQEIGARTGGAVEVRPGNLYRVLDRLSRRGLVAEVANAAAEASRRDYRITERGRQALVAEERLRRRVVEASEGLRALEETA